MEENFVFHKTGSDGTDVTVSTKGTWYNDGIPTERLRSQHIVASGFSNGHLVPAPYDATITFGTTNQVEFTRTPWKEPHWSMGWSRPVTYHAYATCASPPISTLIPSDEVIRSLASKNFLEAEAQNVLSNKVLHYMNNTTSKGSIALAESRQTAAMIVNRAKDLLLILNQLKRGHLSAAYKNFIYVLNHSGRGHLVPHIKPLKRDTLKGANNALLEWKFGWQQLIDDINNAIPLYENLRNASGYGGRVKKFKTRRTSHANKNYQLGEYRNTDATWSVNVSARQSIEIGYTYSLWSPNAAAVNANIGLNPFTLAWELTPLSFMIDWLVNVKGFFESFTFDLGWRFISGYQTVYTEVTHTIKPVSGVKWKASGGKSSHTRIHVYRTVLNGPLRGLLSFRNSLNQGKALTAGQILAQRKL